MDGRARQNGCPDEFEHLPGDGVDGAGVTLVCLLAFFGFFFWISLPVALLALSALLLLACGARLARSLDAPMKAVKF
jgi:hypothetical protein